MALRAGYYGLKRFLRNKLETIAETYDETIKSLFPRSEQAVLGAKNILSLSLSQLKALNTSGTWADNVYTMNGVSYTFGSDGNISVSTGSGSASNVSALMLTGSYTFDNDSILNGCPFGGGSSNYQLDVTGADYIDIGNGVTIPKNTTVNAVRIRIANGATISTPIVFKPMIRLASDSDDTYAPYAMTNKELTEKVTVKSDSITSSFTANGDVANGLKKIGEIVFIDAAYKEVTASQWDVIATIPDGFRPITPCRLLDGFGKKNLVINVNGDIQAAESISNTYVYIHGSWVVGTSSPASLTKENETKKATKKKVIKEEEE